MTAIGTERTTFRASLMTGMGPRDFDRVWRCVGVGNWSPEDLPNRICDDWGLESHPTEAIAVYDGMVGTRWRLISANRETRHVDSCTFERLS